MCVCVMMAPPIHLGAWSYIGDICICMYVLFIEATMLANVYYCGNSAPYSIYIGLQVTRLLRKISMMATPAFLGQSMKEVVLPW